MTPYQFRALIAGVIAILAGAGIITAVSVIPDNQEWLAAVGGVPVGVGIILMIGAFRR